MPGESQRVPGQPKYRSSCDGCGAAKLKCDKVQPECGRCVSHGMQCVYGVSRKMGKPPRRDRARPSVTSTAASDRNSSHDLDPLDTSNTSGGVSAMDLGPFPGVTATDVPSTWDAMDHSTSSLLVNPSALDGLYTDIPSATSLPSFPSLDLSDWPMTDHSSDNLLSSSLHHFGTLPTPESSDFGSYSSTRPPTTQPSALRNQSDHRSPLTDPLSILANESTNHDCPHEAYKILGSLSFLNGSNSQHLPSPPCSSSSSTPGGRIPLDQVLRLNREASDKLGTLMNCSCARSPHLGLLYASIISRILTWYQQAAGCAHPGGRSPAEIAVSALANSGKTPPSPLSAGLSVGPAKMAIGSFNIDDKRVQTALKIQLLSGEMRRAGQLIDQFTSHTNCRGTDDGGVMGGDGLYKSLDSWLRDEHSRVSSMMKTKLRELST